MPKIVVPTPETTELITRPVMFDIMRQLLDITGLPPTMNIVYAGDTEKTKQLNSAITSFGDDPNKFASNDKITIEIEEQYNQDRILNEPVFGPQNLLVFEDAPLKIIMKPVYSGCEAMIHVRYRASNRNLAIRWRDQIKTHVGMYRTVNMHDITYSHAIPPVCLVILKELARMREAVAPYGQTFDEYFETHRHPKVTEITNMNGEASMWVMPESQIQVQGMFDFETPEVGSKDGEGEAWTISFTYKFQYDRPVQMAMMYPLIIHQQLLDRRFRDTSLSIPTQETREKSFAWGTQALYNFEHPNYVSRIVGQRIGYSIPTYDEWRPETILSGSMRVLAIGFTVDDTNYPLFLNLKELGERKFDADIVQYMSDECEWLTKPYGTAVSVSFYRDQFLIDPTPLTINANLDVIATTPLQLRVQHHLRISLIMDLTQLPSDAITRMAEHGRAAIKILFALDATLESRGYMPKLLEPNTISVEDLIVAINNIHPGVNQYGQIISNMATVQTLFIQTLHLPKK